MLARIQKSPVNESPFRITETAAVVVPCRITSKDIAAMDYWLNEAPMSDPSRQNAVCFALKRLLLDDVEVVLRDRPGNKVDAVVNGSIALTLPNELVSWWRKVLVGHLPAPVTALVEVPVDLLEPGLRASLEEKSAAFHSRLVEMRKANAA